MARASALLDVQRSAGNRAAGALVQRSAAIQHPAVEHPMVQRVPTDEGVAQGDYEWSTKWGWIDWSHADPDRSLQLIDKVRQASNAMANPAGGSGDVTSPTMTSGGLGMIMSSASVEVKLRRALSADEVLQVSLSIFKRLSTEFETQQEWTDFVRHSSFSQEDLPSNLLAFYMAARGFGKPDIRRMCGVVDRAASQQEFAARHNFVKNRSFAPIGASEGPPPELSTIDDAAGGRLYDITAINVSRGGDAYKLAPQYRIDGTFGGTDLFFFAWGAVTFSAGDDVQAVPTGQFRAETSGQYGDVTMVEVNPARSQDQQAFARKGVKAPVFIPDRILVRLTTPGG